MTVPNLRERLEQIERILGCQGLLDDYSPVTSAYQIAVENGYVGSEAEWLASLVGPQGPTGGGGGGEPGPQGEQGIQGIPGIAGADGLPGADGAQGLPGNDGVQGLQGEQGLQGVPGADGAQGLPGADGAQGLPGNDGAQGLQGIQGIPGNDGAQGIQGVPGNDGAAGAQGDQGIQGIQGEQGIPGDVSGAWPIGSIFISVVSTNPATLLGFGTWSAFGAGRVLIGLDSGDANFDVVEETGGDKTVTIGAANLPQLAVAVTDPGHVHLLQRYPTATGGSSGFTADTSMSGTPADTTLNTKTNTTGITATANTGGANTAISIVQPYIVVYMWKRTA